MLPLITQPDSNLFRISVVMISRLMLNIQNPHLYGTHVTGESTDCNIGPFVATRGMSTQRFTSVAFASLPDTSHKKRPTWHHDSTFRSGSDSQGTWTTDTSTGESLHLYFVVVHLAHGLSQILSSTSYQDSETTMLLRDTI